MNIKLTLVHLHEAFPEMDLDELLKVLECIVMDPIPFSTPYWEERNVTPTYGGIKL